MDYSEINRTKSYIVENDPFTVLLETEHEISDARRIFNLLWEKGLIGNGVIGKYSIMSGRAVRESWGVIFDRVKIDRIINLGDFEIEFVKNA